MKNSAGSSNRTCLRQPSIPLLLRQLVQQDFARHPRCSGARRWRAHRGTKSTPAGRFPDKFNFTVEWAAAAVLLPWEQYEWTGDRKVLCENYQLMRGFVDYVGRVAEDGIAPGGLGDWYDYGHGEAPGPSRFTPQELTATATWALCADRLARAAAVLDLPDDAERYRQLHCQIAVDFQRRFRDSATGSLEHMGSPQCANAIALCAGVVPEEDREQLVNEIIGDLEQRDWQQTPGTGHVDSSVLAQAGRARTYCTASTHAQAKEATEASWLRD